jgi:hypothetical protein
MPTEFSAGRVLGRSLSLLFSNAGAFLLMTVLLHLPTILFRIYLTTEAPSAGMRESAPLIAACGELILQPLTTASVTYGALQQLRGKPATFLGCLSVGFSRMRSVLLVGLVAGLITVVGLMALCLPGLVAWTIFFVAAPASVVERLNVSDALRRSHDLTLGSRWSIFWLNLRIVAIGLSITMALALAFVDFTAPNPLQTRAYLVVGLTTSLLMEAVQAIAAAVSYAELRRLREGAEPNDFLSAFD